MIDDEDELQYEDDKKLVDKLCAIDHGLNKWEEDFVESVASWVLDQERVLSDDQRKKAEQILDERT